MKTKYNKNQMKAVKYPPQPLLILAGAGTGKTTTIVGRMAYLIQNENAVPESIMALTFTNDAADHLKQKLINNIGELGSKINSFTFHSFAQTLTLAYYKELRYSEPPVIMNKGDIYFLLRSRFNEIKKLRSTLFKRDPVKAIQSFQYIFDAFRQNLLSLSDLISLQKKALKRIDHMIDQNEIEGIYQMADMVDIYPLYQKWKKDNNWIDYGDMISNLWNLIQNNAVILDILQDKYKHIIVDEFQDNNYALSRIIEKIALPENSITVVGDDDQCIYAFRQANIHNVHQFKNRYYNNSQPPIFLMQNYRSNQMILDLANIVIEQNIGRIAKGQLESNILNNQKPIMYIGNANEQLVKLGENISILLENGELPHDIAVLLRTHTKCIQVSLYLHTLGISTYYHAEKLYEQTVIKDIISMLHILAETEKSDHALLRLLKKHISTDQITALTQSYISDKSKISLVKLTLNSNHKIKKTMKTIIEPVKYSKWDNMSELVWQIIKLGGIYRNISINECVDQKVIWQSLNQFRNIVNNYCQNYDEKDLKTFTAFIDIQSEVNDTFLEPLEELSEQPAVRVMTVHSAKGMEYKHVYIPFLRSGSFPLHYRRMNMIDRLPVEWQRWNTANRDEKELHYEEERRLFYVAITRAKDSLTLFAPKKSQSSFIKDIDHELLRKEIIMEKEQNLSICDKLIGRYRAELQVELNMEHYKTATHLISAIENISMIKKGNDPKWGDNPFKREINKILSENNFEISSKKPRLSATSIQTYNLCPLKYKYQYIDAIPGAPEKTYFQLGKVIHKVLEIFHEAEYSSLNDLLNLLEINWKEGGYEYVQEKEQDRQDAEDMLKNYWKFIQANPVNKLFTEHCFIFETEDALLSGKCDRIDVDDNDKISIVDYKTSRVAKSSNKLKKDIQLGIYALFLVLKGVELSKDKLIQDIPKKLSMLFLRDNDPEVSVQFSVNDLNYFKDKIKSTADGIKGGKFEGSKGKHCNWCDYRALICPLFG